MPKLLTVKILGALYLKTIFIFWSSASLSLWPTLYVKFFERFPLVNVNESLVICGSVHFYRELHYMHIKSVINS